MQALAPKEMDTTPDNSLNPSHPDPTGGRMSTSTPRAGRTPGTATSQERSLSRNYSICTELSKKLDIVGLEGRYSTVGDDVFTEQDTPTNPAGGTGKCYKTEPHSQGFPPAYGVIRAGKVKKMGQSPLGCMQRWAKTLF